MEASENPVRARPLAFRNQWGGRYIAGRRFHLELTEILSRTD